MRMTNRLRRLEEAAGVGCDDGCPACRERRVICVTSQRLPDGTTVPEGHWPAPCEACGGMPEIIIEAVKPVAPYTVVSLLPDG